MASLDDRFLQLKGEIEELKIIQDEKNQIRIQKNEMGELSSRFDDSVKNSEIKLQSQKELVVASLEYLRASNDIVKKISEKTSHKFEDEINNLEKKYFEWFKDTNELSKKFFESSKKIKEITKEGIKSFQSEEVNSAIEDADINIKNITEKNIQGKKISKEIEILSSNISMMTDGFDSLIDFLDGNR